MYTPAYMDRKRKRGRKRIRGREERDRDLGECVALAIINFQDRSHVPTAITIIRGTKYSYHLLFLFQANNWEFKNPKYFILSIQAKK